MRNPVKDQHTDPLIQMESFYCHNIRFFLKCIVTHHQTSEDNAIVSSLFNYCQE